MQSFNKLWHLLSGMPGRVLDPGSGVIRIKELVKNADTWAPSNTGNVNLRLEPASLYFSRNSTLEPLGIHLDQVKDSALTEFTAVEHGDKTQARTAQSDESYDGRNGSRTGGYGFLEEGWLS